MNNKYIVFYICLAVNLLLKRNLSSLVTNNSIETVAGNISNNKAAGTTNNFSKIAGNSPHNSEIPAIFKYLFEYDDIYYVNNQYNNKKKFLIEMIKCNNKDKDNIIKKITENVEVLKNYLYTNNYSKVFANVCSSVNNFFNYLKYGDTLTKDLGFSKLNKDAFKKKKY